MAVFQETDFRASIHKAVTDLIGDNWGSRQSGLRSLKLSKREIANADEANLALIHQLFHGTHRFLDGNGRVRPVKLVKIDIIRFECLKTTIGGLEKILASKIPRGSFSCQEDLIANIPNDFAHETLGSVSFRRINEAGAEFDSLSQGLHAASILPGSKSDFGNCQLCGAKSLVEHERQENPYLSIGSSLLKNSFSVVSQVRGMPHLAIGRAGFP